VTGREGERAKGEEEMHAEVIYHAVPALIIRTLASSRKLPRRGEEKKYAPLIEEWTAENENYSTL